MLSMKKQVLFVQGGGDGARDVDAKLVESLRKALGQGYEVRYPEMPNESKPDYAIWKSHLIKEIKALDDDLILVAHSVGATILINALAQSKPKRTLAGIFLIAAPFLGEGGWKSEDFVPVKRLGSHLPKGVPIYLYHGRDDEIAPFGHIDLYASAIPHAHVRRLSARDHQLNNDLKEVAEDIRQLRQSHTRCRD